MVLVLRTTPQTASGLFQGTTSSHSNIFICKMYHICCVQTGRESDSAPTA